MLTVYLGNKYIRAVEGEVSGGRLHVRRAYETIDQNGAILNGTIVDEEALFGLLKELWETNKLPKKDVNLVLNSNQFTTRGMRLPSMSPGKMMEYLEREFAGVERMEEPVYGYFQLQKPDKAKMQRIMAMAVPRAYALKFVGMFKRLGIQLSGIESVGASINRLMDMLTLLKGKTCIIQFVEDMNLTNVLWYNGGVETSNRKRLFSDPGTPSYLVEIARAVSNLTQFAKAQNIDQLITHVYVAGISQEDFSIYEDSVHNVSAELEVAPLSGGENIVVDAPDGDRLFARNSLAIGGLAKIDPDTNIASQLKYTQEELDARKKRKRILIPIAIGGVALLLASLALFVRNIYLGSKLDGLEAYNNDPKVIQTCAEYDALNETINAASGIAEGLERLTGELEKYPLVDSQAENTVVTCANGLVTASISGYDSKTGVLSLQAKAADVEQIHQFINRLTGQEIFAAVNYTGYTQDREGAWNVNVACVMAPGKEAEQ